uniref:HAT family dimerisation domain containing protein n=1 Tax=Tanacetum cinerariifolium TaxID=118510 RepID=A0A699HV59_TANCI|nr:hAT family dimerisation domain containing protein [Tanacetum cinerariifolium]
MVPEAGKSSMSRDRSLFMYNSDVLPHWIKTGTWQMMKRVIAFEDIPVPHTGDALARMLRKVFVNFNLEDKIMSITLDDVSNNTSAIEFLIESISTDLEFFDDGYTTKAIKWFIDSLEGLYNIYYAKHGNPTTTESSSGASSSRASGGNQMSRLLNRLKEHTDKKAKSDPSLSFEYERYVHSDFVTHLQYSEFAAFDVLVSISGRALSIQRTRLTMASLEMCMCLKDHLDAQERKQAKSSLENPVDFEEEILDAEVQQNEAISLSDEKITLDAANSEGTMSGSGSGGEEVDYDKTNYGDDY